MEPKMALDTPFFQTFFTYGPKPRLWSNFCPILAHFGCPEAPFWPLFWAPKASILVPTAFVLEFLDNPFLEQNTSHTDAHFVTRCRKQMWKTPAKLYTYAATS